MESLVNDSLFNDLYRQRRVLITGHTGFKGSWLTLWLQQMGAQVAGIALDPESKLCHWDLLPELHAGMVADHRFNITEKERVEEVVSEFSPEMIFHLAAQPLVRRSYTEPVDTWASNVMGTVNLLDAARRLPDLRAIVVVTSDKCYDNRSLERGYREDDPLGGFDPYSASKAATELAAASFSNSFFSDEGTPVLATARAGNVIGGGDWGEDRLIPDLCRAMAAGEELEIRFPNATRPWQHVLDALSGYLLLGARLLVGDRSLAGAWNYGPDREGACSVEGVLDRLRRHWPQLCWHVTTEVQPHEAAFLQLDCGKAMRELAWRPVWQLDRALEQTALWYDAFLTRNEILSIQQLQAYIADASSQGQVWR